MEMTLARIAALVGGETEGDDAVTVRAVSSAASARPDTLTFAEDERSFAAAVASPAAAVIVGRKAPPAPGKPLLRADHPRLAFVRAARILHPEERPAPGIHPAAVVSAGARLGRDVSVGPGAAIDDGAEVGDRAAIGPGCHVGAGARIGADCRLYANVTLYPAVTLGERVIVHAGAVLGADGFGYVDTKEGKEKFPQLGTLLVEDDVEIGANTTIDRGALDATIIRAGTKIDNLVQIAHNVEIGRLCAISSQTGIAGTSRLGNRVICGGAVGIGDHVTIGDGAVLGGRTGVLSGKVLPGGAVYWGTPARPLREVKRSMGAASRVERLLGRIEKLEARIAELEGSSE